MERKHIITISGRPGSGKSTTSNEVAKMLGYQRFSGGGLMRDIAEKRGVTLEELNRFAETDQTIDEELDEALRKLGNSNNIVIDSRLGYHWIPDSFKVYLYLDLEVAAARIFKNMTEVRIKSGEAADSVIEVMENLQRRIASEKKRYQELYHINPYDHTHYDLVINTARNNPWSVALKVRDTYLEWLDSDNWVSRHDELPPNFSMR